jgi:hypothetical protein
MTDSYGAVYSAGRQRAIRGFLANGNTVVTAKGFRTLQHKHSASGGYGRLVAALAPHLALHVVWNIVLM